MQPNDNHIPENVPSNSESQPKSRVSRQVSKYGFVPCFAAAIVMIGLCVAITYVAIDKLHGANLLNILHLPNATPAVNISDVSQQLESAILTTRLQTNSTTWQNDARIAVSNGVDNAAGYSATYQTTDTYEVGFDFSGFGSSDSGTGTTLSNQTWTVTLPPPQLLSCSVKINNIRAEWWTAFTPATLGTETRNVAEYDSLVSLRDEITKNPQLFAQAKDQAASFMNTLLTPIVSKYSTTLTIAFATPAQTPIPDSCQPPQPACFKRDTEGNWQWNC